MLSIREQLFKGLLTETKKVQSSTKIPRKSAFLGTITQDGYCDYEVCEEDWFITKDNTRANRMALSDKARKHRKELRALRNKH